MSSRFLVKKCKGVRFLPRAVFSSTSTGVQQLALVVTNPKSTSLLREGCGNRYNLDAAPPSSHANPLSRLPTGAMQRSRKAAVLGEGSVVEDYGDSYDTFTKDILGDGGDGSDSDDGWDAKKQGKKLPSRRGRKDDGEDEEPSTMFFDFRKGEKEWPKNAELVDQKRIEALLEKATLAAEEAAKNKSDKDSKVKDSPVSIIPILFVENALLMLTAALVSAFFFIS